MHTNLFAQLNPGCQAFQRALALLALVVLLICACSSGQASDTEIIIGLTDESLSLLKSPGKPEPQDTGITSLDNLNKKWRVIEMQPIFPDLPKTDQAAEQFDLKNLFLLRRSGHVNIERMVREYAEDPNIEFAEPNAKFEGL